MSKTHNQSKQTHIEREFTPMTTSLLEPFERKYVTPLVKLIPSFIGARYLVLIMALWSIGALLAGYLSRFDIQWLWLHSLFILLHIITDYLNDLIVRIRKTGLTRWNYYMGQFLDYLFLCAVLIGYSFTVTSVYTHLMFYTLAIFGAFMVNTFLTLATTEKLRTSYLRIGFTEVRVLFIIVNTFLIVAGRVYFANILPFIFIFSAVGLMYVMYKTQKEIWELDVGKPQRMFTFTQRVRIGIGFAIFGVLLICMSIYAFLTNPFNEMTVYQPPHTTEVVNGEIVLKNSGELIARQDLLNAAVAYFKAPFHILIASVFPEKPVEGDTAQEIIHSIHESKYDPEENPFIVTGGHFSMLYVRNLGVFYHPVLDPYTALSQEDWENRQRVYLQTAAYALDSLSQCDKPYTTLVTTGITSVSCINIYHYPSDSVYGLLYSLHTLQTSEEIQRIYHRNEPPPAYELQTQTAAKNLVATHKDELKNLVDTYYEKVYDAETGLVRKDLRMSSAKDASVRQSAFYDNVILWRTMDLATKLGVRNFSQQERDALKDRILEAFWDEEEGIFYEDLSEESIDQKLYSSDWLAVLFTGFLDPYNPEETKYFSRNVAYINAEEIDEPFPIKYQQNNRNHRDVFLIRIFAPAYGGSSIWSLWGMEYIKLLGLLHDVTDEETYLFQGGEHLMSYRQNIEEYSGFPEVYDSTGNIMDERFYNSVLSTSWVVNFEQADVILERGAQE
jgi:hypothetical protein